MRSLYGFELSYKVYLVKGEIADSCESSVVYQTTASFSHCCSFRCSLRFLCHSRSYAIDPTPARRKVLVPVSFPSFPHLKLYGRRPLESTSSPRRHHSCSHSSARREEEGSGCEAAPMSRLPTARARKSIWADGSRALRSNSRALRHSKQLWHLPVSLAFSACFLPPFFET